MAEIQIIINNIDMFYKRKEIIKNLFIKPTTTYIYNDLKEFIFDDNPHKPVNTELKKLTMEYEHIYKKNDWIDTFWIKYNWLQNHDGSLLTDAQKQGIIKYCKANQPMHADDDVFRFTDDAIYILGDGVKSNPGLWLLMHHFLRRLNCLIDRLKGQGKGPCPSIEEQLGIINPNIPVALVQPIKPIKICEITLILLILSAQGLALIKKSVPIEPNRELDKILKKITKEIIDKFPEFTSPFEIKVNKIKYTHHVELVDDENDVNNKNKNYIAISSKEINLCDMNNWYKEGNAVVLYIGQYPGHKTPLHITVVYNSKGFTDETLGKIKQLIMNIVSV